VKIDFIGIYTSVKALNDVQFANLRINSGAVFQRQQVSVLKLKNAYMSK
jgi:hypothetical protein